MNHIRRLSGDTLKAIEVFCGYGGYGIALEALGVQVVEALNHWAHAVDVYGANHPRTKMYLGDVKETHPRHHARTPLFVGSAACTDFSQANPKNVKTLLDSQLRLFDDNMDPVEYEKEYERAVARHQGRATMFDIVEFAQHHQYHYGITENVIEVHKWALFELWCRDLYNAGFDFKFLYLNAMFFHELNGVHGMPIIPQSRDRWICVFWRRGNKPPDLEFRPLAPCPRCGDVRAVQVWKNPKKLWGRYGLKHGSYYYGCPTCRENYRGHPRPLPVEPYYYAGINGVDWSVPIRRVDDPDREQPVSAATKHRLAVGLEKYGYEPLILDIQRTGDGHVKSRSALLTPLFAQTGTATQAVAVPPIYLTDAAHRGHLKDGWVAPLYTQTSGDTQGVALTPFLVTLGGDRAARAADEPFNTMTTMGSKNGVALAPLFFLEMYGGGKARAADEPLNTVTAGGGKTGLATPAFFVERTGPAHAEERARLREVTDPFNTQTAGGVRTGLAVPFFVTYNTGHSVKRHGGEPLAAMTTVERHGMTWPRPSVEECYYRTLRSKVVKKGAHGSTYVTSEIGAAQGFPQGPDGFRIEPKYSTDDITKGFGNAIPPGEVYWVLDRVLDVMK
ncbi:MAG: DNA cytosine methyltransferase [Anaerolineae bacterium]|nr:DNA cytosine methyltransferase [Anaerolineae bacterium]